MQGQQLILYTLFITVSYATKINFFDAIAELPLIGNQSTVHADYLQLWADVTECPSIPCSCQVQSNASTGNPFSVTFLEQKPNKGYVNVSSLQPDTMYSFTISCEGTVETKTCDIQTDYGNPSAPQNITVILNSKRLKVSWLRPSLPAGPISNYKLTINQNPTIDNIPSDNLAYDIKEDYVYGTRYTFVLYACNTNKRNESVCSNPNDAMATFYLAMTTTTPISTASSQSSSAMTTTTPISTASSQSSSAMFYFTLCFLQFVFSTICYSAK